MALYELFGGLAAFALGMLASAGVLFAAWGLMASIIRWNKALRQASRELGIAHYESGLVTPGRAAGTSRGVRVTVDQRWQITNPLRWVEVLLPGGERPIRRWTRVTAWADVPETMRLYRRPRTEGGARREIQEADVLTGDEAFDELIVARGPAGEVVGRLDEHARETGRVAVVQLGGSLGDGAMVIERPGAVHDGPMLSLLGRTAVRMVVALRSKGRGADQLLFQRFEGDAVDEVRVRAFDVLVAREADSPSARQAVARVLSAADPDLVADAFDEEERLIRLADSGAPLVAIGAAHRLADVGGRAAIPTLEPWLEHEQSERRAAAERALRFIRLRLKRPSEDGSEERDGGRTPDGDG